MGGLAGLVHFDGDAPDPRVVEAVAARLAHRGPDGHGAWAEGPAALAHRLRRVQPGHKLQPCVADDLVVLLDGWIYDHEELGRSAGVEAEGLTDTEALLHAWRRWGLDALERIEGEFALAIWDRRGRALTLVRDRLGVRPLHWAGRGGRVAFASELPALLEVPWVSRDPDPTRLAEYLSFQVVHAPRTLLQDVSQVEPGCWLQATRDGIRTRRWWRLRYAPPGTPRPSEGEVIERLQEAVGRAVRKRVPRAVETGLYLSGGLGSAAIAAAARERYLELPGFTVSFADDPFPEAPFAGRVAKLLGIEHHEVVVGTAELAAGFDETVRALGQPIGHPAAVLQLALAAAARQRVRVALSGDGGEELFGGRMLDDLGRELRLARAFARLPGPVRGPVGRMLAASDRGRRVATPLDRYALELGLGGANLFTAEERAKLLRDHGLVRPGVRREVLAPFYDGLDTDLVNTALHGYLRSSLGEAGLTRADRTGAARGLDVRFPLLDREVVEAAAALPGSFKLRRTGGSLHTRWPLRAMLTGILPPVLVDRPKRGLPAPLGTWLAGPGTLFLEDRLRRLKRDPLGLWRPEALDALRRDATRSNAAGNRLWTLFVLDEWLAGLSSAPRPGAPG